MEEALEDNRGFDDPNVQDAWQTLDQTLRRARLASEEKEQQRLEQKLSAERQQKVVARLQRQQSELQEVVQRQQRILEGLLTSKDAHEIVEALAQYDVRGRAEEHVPVLRRLRARARQLQHVESAKRKEARRQRIAKLQVRPWPRTRWSQGWV
jgi:hypothetical protein